MKNLRPIGAELRNKFRALLQALHRSGNIGNLWVATEAVCRGHAATHQVGFHSPLWLSDATLFWRLTDGRGGKHCAWFPVKWSLS